MMNGGKIISCHVSTERDPVPRFITIDDEQIFDITLVSQYQGEPIYLRIDFTYETGSDKDRRVELIPWRSITHLTMTLEAVPF